MADASKNVGVSEYDSYSCGRLEKAFQTNSKEKISFTDKDGKKHSVSVKNMTDDVIDGSNAYSAKVKRIPTESTKLPDRWDPMASGETHKLVDLSSVGSEFMRVEKHFRATSNNLIKSIIKIQRIQNPSLYRQYKVKMLSMESDLPLYGGKKIEMRLWHGTSSDVIPKINSNNFNRSYGGVHGLVYGNGVYFAVNSQYSISGYCTPDVHGRKYIYQARVLVGNAGQGAFGLKEPPLKDPAKGILYDSVVDRLNAPSMYVIFYDYQMYPEYLITFQ
ncbi:hypothetical protein HELRODRAFT_104522 [Helobdella robusta]|uniref:Poly [ADP-ribose] polymerase n=1 Tax=Helobdella robusta TaxID=6412 RepID=T1EDM0_HELRO|nr:hypothetical protein HELRODRAFT_104522 [Helobdella robusta]ESN90024.1 hypothetical protein HELRODRAFT_104522 [Helobdella robusta]